MMANFSVDHASMEKLLKSAKNTVTLYINDKPFTVTNPDPETYLIDFLREKNLPGTKFGCGEGGCGACTVMISSWDNKSQKAHSMSANSCLLPLCAVDGCSITTIEGLGNMKSLHPIQKLFAENNASQCGFCSPGLIMSIYSSLLNWTEKPNRQELTVADLEKDLGGNLCRCTGYRPILQTIIDITKEPAKFQKFLKFPAELKEYTIKPIEIEHNNRKWFTPTSLKEMLDIKKKYKEACRIVIGNTELGIDERFKFINYGAYINGVKVPELREFSEKTVNDVEGLWIGPSTTITELHEHFSELIKEKKGKGEDFKTRGLKAACAMIDRFASTPVRNAAAVAGNIVTASPTSDLNPVWCAMNAKITLIDSVSGEQRVVAMRDFFKQYKTVDMKPTEIILGLFVPYTEKNEFVKAFKQSRRREDDIAIVNGCIRTKINAVGEDRFKIEDISAAFGGMSFKTVCAHKTEKLLIGKEITLEPLSDGRMQFEQVLEEINQELMSEFTLPENVPGGQSKFRTTLVLSFFYKFYLHLLKEGFGAKLLDEKSDAKIVKMIKENENHSNAEHNKKDYKFKVDYEHAPEDHIVGNEATHINAKLQSTGQATYIDDMPKFEGELEGAPIISTVPLGKIKSIDASAALKLEGVLGYINSKDIPAEGSNHFHLIAKDEYAFWDDKITSVGQVVGLIVAKDRATAKRAASLVKVEYEIPQEKPILTIDEAIEKESYYPERHVIETGKVDETFAEAEKDPENYLIFDGKMYMGGQEHFYLEPQSVVAVPKEGDEMEVIASTQNPTEGQVVVADVLGVPMHKVVCKTKRLGGAFGGKESRPVLIAVPAAIAARKFNKPVRIVLERDIDMQLSGQRHAFLGKYKVAIRKSDGKIVAYNVDLFNNAGYSLDLSQSILDRGLFHIDASYYIPNLRVRGFACKTNTVSNTAFRGFGGPQGMMVTETMLERAATKLNIPVEKLREVNFYQEGDHTHYGQKIVLNTIPKVWNTLKTDSEFENRKQAIDQFNKENQFKKRGISMIPVKFGIAFTAHFLNQGGALVLVYKDGSVLVSHGGVEMGQGLHTKVAQTVAQSLGIPLSKVVIGDTSTDKVPNTSPTAASSGSDINCAATLDACEKLNERLKKYREIVSKDPKLSQLPKGEKWQKIVNMAFFDRISLSATGFFKMPNIHFDFKVGKGQQFAYYTVGAACSEVEIDLLTGDHRVVRADIVMDLGSSINPSIDIGQLEGSYIQGMGLYTLEDMVKGDKYHPWLKPGSVFTKGPGFYKIPSIDDVPEQLNIQLLKASPNPFAVHRSKAVGEPPLFMSASVAFALRDAIKEGRKQHGVLNSDFEMHYPVTSERIRMHNADPISKKLVGEKVLEEANEFIWSSY